MTSAFDDYLRRRKFHGPIGFSEPETLQEFQARQSRELFSRRSTMAFPMKRRHRFSVPFSKRRRIFKARRRRNQLANFALFQKKRPRGRGYVRQYNRKAFRGKPRLTAAKVAKCIETKVFFSGIYASTGTPRAATVSYPTVAGSDRLYLWAPLQNLIQFDSAAGPTQEVFTFNGECIWLRGFSVEGYLVGQTPDQYEVHFHVWKVPVHDRTPGKYSGNDFISSDEGSTASQSQRYFQFFDMAYPPGADVNSLVSRSNPNSGSTMLFHRKYKFGTPLTESGASVAYFQKFKFWIPLNQMYRLQALEGQDLHTAPNFGAHGDYYVGMYWFTGTEAGGLGASTLRIAGLNARIYFKDP